MKSDEHYMNFELEVKILGKFAATETLRDDLTWFFSRELFRLRIITLGADRGSGVYI